MAVVNGCPLVTNAQVLGWCVPGSCPTRAVAALSSYKCQLCSGEATVSNCSSLLVWKYIGLLFFYPEAQPPSSSDSSDDSSSESQDSDSDSSEGDENDEPLSLQWPESRTKQAIYLFLFPIVFPLWSTLPDVRNPVRIYLPSATGVINWAIDFLWARVPGSSFPCLESLHSWRAVTAAGSGTGASAAV